MFQTFFWIKSKIWLISFIPKAHALLSFHKHLMILKHFIPQQNIFSLVEVHPIVVVMIVKKIPVSLFVTILELFIIENKT